MKVADPVTVDLYRLAYNAGRAVTFDELVDGMPSAYQNDANRWWVEKEKAAGRDVPPDPWSSSMLRSVKTEWLAEEVFSLINTKRFSVDRSDGKSGKGYSTRGVAREYLLYSANKQNPPRVFEEALVRRVVPWTPEIGATGRRHVAGIKFRDEVARIKGLGAKATKQDLEKALELAAEALSLGRHDGRRPPREECTHFGPAGVVMGQNKSLILGQLGSVMYLSRIPAAAEVPAGLVVVHNHVVPPARRLGTRGFRAWLAEPDEGLSVCECGWGPETGTHYKVVSANV